MKKLSSAAPLWENITVLSVSAEDGDHEALEELLAPRRCGVLKAHSCNEALRAIRTHLPTVVACERELPDGSWKDLFAGVSDMEGAPPVVVMSLHADERLWAEV